MQLFGPVGLVCMLVAGSNGRRVVARESAHEGQGSVAPPVLGVCIPSARRRPHACSKEQATHTARWVEQGPTLHLLALCARS